MSKKTKQQKTAKTTQKESKPKVLKGIVVSDKMQKTLVVEVNRLIRHPIYNKRFMKSKKYKVHYDGSDIKQGDKVTIQETGPVSKGKKWKILNK